MSYFAIFRASRSLTLGCFWLSLVTILFVSSPIALADGSNSVFLSWQKKITSEYLDKIKKQGFLRIIVDPTLPPLEYYNAKSQLVGFDIDLANTLAAEIGVKAIFVETTYDEAFTNLSANPNSVIISGIKKLAEARPGYEFFEYAEISQLILGKNKVTGVNDFVGKQIGVLSASQARINLQNLANSGVKIKRIRGFENLKSMENALKTGIIDYVIADSVAITKFQNSSNKKWLISDKPFCNESLAFVVRDKDIGLAFLLQSIVKKHQGEKISKSFIRWFKSSS